MKIIGTLAVVLTVGIALLQPAQARSRGGGYSSSSTHHFSTSSGHFSSRPGNFSGGTTARYYRTAPHVSSQAAFRNRGAGPRFAVNRANALSPKAYSASNARLATSRRAALRSGGFSNQGRVLRQHTRNWNRRHDHFWNGHRCRWHNNAWVIIDPWFYPWGYGWGYPYGTYSYYDDRYASSEYDTSDSDLSVSELQSALARNGYYHGAIDGSMGPATRSALRRYQRDSGLDVTGQVDQPVIDALRLR